MTAPDIFELPADDEDLHGALASVEAGRIVVVTSHGQAVGAFTPMEVVLRARVQAVDLSLASVESQLDAATVIAKGTELLNPDVRERILGPVNALVRKACEEPSNAIARLVVALAEHQPDAVTVAFDWAEHLPAAARAELVEELAEATHADNPNPPSIRQILVEWQHTAEAYGDSEVLAALTSNHDDHGRVQVPEAA